jgi:hypothetical protein
MLRRTDRTPRGLAAAAVALALALPGAARAQAVDLAQVFKTESSQPVLSGVEILARSLDNLYGFDASISVVTETRPRGGSGAPLTSEFLIERRRIQGALRQLVVSLRPADVRGTRILQVNYGDGREETYAFLPSVGGEPMPARFRLAEPFLGTWHEIAADEPRVMELLPLAQYEVLGLQQATAQNEPAYLLTVRPLVERGYDWAQLLIARKDFAILEQRQYLGNRNTPTLVCSAPRTAMVRFEGHLVPEQLRYTDLGNNSEIAVRLVHASLPEGSEALFFPRTFHRVPIPGLTRP